MRFLVLISLFFAGLSSLDAQIQTKTIEYRDGETILEGFLAWDAAKIATPRPSVLVIHQWMGLTDYEKQRCVQLAELGYVAMAVDIYGKGVRPSGMPEAAQQAGKYKKDRTLFRQRLNAGLAELKKQTGVDAQKIAAIGYCFGGTGAIELARAGAPIVGAVSFHGGLDSPTPDDGKNITAKLLICHGADDPFVPAAEIEAFKTELNQAKVDWQMIYYSGAVHSFTQSMAGKDNSQGAAYNEAADRRSWLAMRSFFDEVFQ